MMGETGVKTGTFHEGPPQPLFGGKGKRKTSTEPYGLGIMLTLSHIPHRVGKTFWRTEYSTVLTSSLFQVAPMDRGLKVRLLHVLDLLFEWKGTF